MITDRQAIQDLIERLGKLCGTEKQDTELEYTMAVFHDALSLLYPDERGKRRTYYDDYPVPQNVRRPRLIWKP